MGRMDDATVSVRRSARRDLPAIALVVAVLLIAACGSADDTTTDASTPDPSTAPATISPATISPATTSPVTTSPVTTSPATTSPATTSPATTEPARVSADDIPVAFTPAGGWTEMPPPVLDTCTEPLVPTAPDLRGTWTVIGVEVDGAEVADHAALGEIQRIEQCGDRVVITAGGIVHDMRADGTLDGAVRDVAASDFSTPIVVVASFEDGVHVLRPDGVPIEITRRLDGEQMIWTYLGFTARLDRTG